MTNLYIFVQSTTIILFVNRVPQEDPSGRTIILEAGEYQRIKVRLSLQGFWYFVRPRSCKILVKLQTPTKFARNLVQYTSIQHIWNFSRLLGLFNCRKLAKLSSNFITTMSKQHPKTIRHKFLCCENWYSHDVKTFSLAHFSSTLLLK